MTFWSDVRDYCGGWPLDFVTAAKMMQYLTKSLGAEVLRFRQHGQFEFLVRRRDPYGSTLLDNSAQKSGGPGSTVRVTLLQFEAALAAASAPSNVVSNSANLLSFLGPTAVSNLWSALVQGLGLEHEPIQVLLRIVRGVMRSSAAWQFEDELIEKPRQEMQWVEDRVVSQTLCWPMKRLEEDLSVEPEDDTTYWKPEKIDYDESQTTSELRTLEHLLPVDEGHTSVASEQLFPLYQPMFLNSPLAGDRSLLFKDEIFPDEQVSLYRSFNLFWRKDLIKGAHSPFRALRTGIIASRGHEYAYARAPNSTWCDEDELHFLQVEDEEVEAATSYCLKEPGFLQYVIRSFARDQGWTKHPGSSDKWIDLTDPSMHKWVVGHQNSSAVDKSGEAEEEVKLLLVSISPEEVFRTISGVFFETVKLMQKYLRGLQVLRKVVYCDTRSGTGRMRFDRRFVVYEDGDGDHILGTPHLDLVTEAGLMSNASGFNLRGGGVRMRLSPVSDNNPNWNRKEYLLCLQTRDELG